MAESSDGYASEVRELRYVNQLDAEEREAMDHLLAFMGIVVNRWKLRANHGELAPAIHILQGFVTQHMLARQSPEHWGDWWESGRVVER